MSSTEKNEELQKKYHQLLKSHEELIEKYKICHRRLVNCDQYYQSAKKEIQSLQLTNTHLQNQIIDQEQQLSHLTEINTLLNQKLISLAQKNFRLQEEVEVNLQLELRSLKEQLQIQKEINRISQQERQRLMSEVEDLTTSLFEEASKMVRDQRQKDDCLKTDLIHAKKRLEAELDTLRSMNQVSLNASANVGSSMSFGSSNPTPKEVHSEAVSSHAEFREEKRTDHSDDVSELIPVKSQQCSDYAPNPSFFSTDSAHSEDLTLNDPSSDQMPLQLSSATSVSSCSSDSSLSSPLSNAFTSSISVSPS